MKHGYTHSVAFLALCTLAYAGDEKRNQVKMYGLDDLTYAIICLDKLEKVARTHNVGIHYPLEMWSHEVMHMQPSNIDKKRVHDMTIAVQKVHGDCIDNLKRVIYESQQPQGCSIQ